MSRIVIRGQPESVEREPPNWCRISDETHRCLQEMKEEMKASERTFKNKMKQERCKLEEAQELNHKLQQIKDNLCQEQAKLEACKMVEGEYEGRKGQMYELAQVFKQKMLDEEARQQDELAKKKDLEHQLECVQKENEDLDNQMKHLEKESYQAFSRLEADIKDVRWQTQRMLQAMTTKESMLCEHSKDEECGPYSPLTSFDFRKQAKKLEERFTSLQFPDENDCVTPP